MDGANPSATDAGSGSVAVPYKTIQAAVTARGSAGNTLLVRPAIYREQVTISNSGAAGSHIVLQASPSGAVISGSDDFSDAGRWTAVAGDVYLASGVTWAPAQVFVDGTRLAASTDPPASIAAGTFRFVSGIGLYVNVGGGNPGLRSLEVGRRLYGVVMNGSFVTLDGFQVTRTDDKAVWVKGDDELIQNNTVTFANKFGIQLAHSTNSTVLRNVTSDNHDHGIFLGDSSSFSRVQFNDSFRNAKPGVRQANGINVNGTTNVLIEGNLCHDNQDSGVQFYSGANDCISVNNVSWNNGDHGFDHLASTNIEHVHDIAYGNYKDGFSIEGASTGASIYNCIASDNGLTTNEYDLWVSDDSFSGFDSNYNIFWNSTAQKPVKIGTSIYSTVAAYSSATGRDAKTKQSDPKFILPSAGNFHLMSGSPAIDAAKGGISNWPAADLDGNARFDDPATSNTGGGTPTFADRGAYEFRSAGARPVAVLSITPTRGFAPLMVSADASLSTDSDGTIASYVFDFGDGTVIGPQTSPFASHASAAGIWTVKLTVADNLGQTATATAKDTVINPDRAPVVITPASGVIQESQTIQFTVTASDPDGNAIDSLLADTSALPGTGTANFTVNGTRTSGVFTWTPPTGAARATPYSVSFRAVNALSGSAATAITVEPLNLLPNAALSVTPRSGNSPLTVTASASSSFDPDGTVVSYRFDFGDGTIVGPQASPTATHTYAAGNWNVQVIVTDNRGGSSVSAPVAVQALGQSANRASNPGFESGITGWSTTSNDTLFRVAGGRTGAWALEMRSASTNTTGLFGANDSPDIISNSGPIGSHFHFEAWVRSESHHGSAKLRIREYTGAILQGLPTLSPAVTLSPTWQKLSLDYVTVGANSTLDFNIVDAPATAGEIFLVDDVVVQSTAVSQPVVTAPASAGGPENSPITFTVTAGDPDGEAILSLGANFAGLPPGNDATFTVNAAKTLGTFRWTPTHDDARAAAYNVTFIASNSMSGSATTPIVVTDADRAPVVQSPVSVAVLETQPVTIQVTASDPDADAIASLTANVAGLPAGAGAVFTPNASRTAGTLTWTPTAAHGPATYTVVFTAANGLSGSSSTQIVVNNRGPVVTAPATVTGTEGQPLTFGVTATDPDGLTITLLTANLAVLPAGHDAAFVSNAAHTAGTFTWTPTFADSGTYAVIVSAGNTNAMSGSDTTLVRVLNVDRPPVVTAPATATATENQKLTMTVTAADADGQPITSLTADLSALPAGHDAVFTPNAQKSGGTLTWTPDHAGAPGPYSVTFTAANTGSGSAATQIAVTNVDRAPLVQGPSDLTVLENQDVSVEITASDPDGDAITSLAANLSAMPVGHNAVFTANPARTGGTLTWTPRSADRGPYAVIFTAANARSGVDTVSLTIDHLPRITAIPAATINENQKLVLTIVASDPDGQPVTGLKLRPTAHEPFDPTNLSAVEPDFGNLLSLTGDLAQLPAGHDAVIVPAAPKVAGTQAWTLTWTPTYSDSRVAPYALIFTASNSLSSTTTMAVTVRNVDRAPRVVALSSAIVAKGVAMTMSVQANDPDGDPIASLSADLSHLPAGNTAEFTPNPTNTGGTLSWTPRPNDGPGPYAVTFTAVNAMTGTATTAVSATNAPVVTVAPVVVVNEGQHLSLTVSASDPDGDAISSLSADLSGLPSGHGAVFTPNVTRTSGTLTWTPTYVDGRLAPYHVSFVAGNVGFGSASSAITVANVDRSPVVTAPATAVANESNKLTLTITASDPDGDAITSLTADLTGLPAGHDAVFTPNGGMTGGTLTWTPTANDGRTAPAYDVAFTASNALSGTDSTAITVNDTPPGGLVANPGFETNLNGWARNGTATLTRVAGGRSGAWCIEVKTTSSATFGITDNPSWVTAVPAAGTQYRLTAWVRSAAHHGDAKIKVRELVGSSQQGSSAYSNAVVLSPTWQKITFDYVARTANSYLDVEINDYPAVGSETFQIDDIAIVKLPAAAMLAAQVETRIETPSGPAFAVSMSNPVRASGTLNFTTTQSGPVRFEIFDVTGRLVREPVNEFVAAGRHTMSIGTRDGGTRLEKGAYFYRLHAAEGVKSGRFIVLE